LCEKDCRMISCPQCGRKVDVAAEKCLCGFSFAQNSPTFSIKKEPQPGEGERGTIHVPLTGAVGGTTPPGGQASSSNQGPSAGETKPPGAESTASETPGPPPAASEEAKAPAIHTKSPEEEELEAERLAYSEKAQREQEAKSPTSAAAAPAGPEPKDLHVEKEAEDATAASSAPSEAVKESLHEEEEALELGPTTKALHVEEEAEDVTTHEKLEIEAEAEDAEGAGKKGRLAEIKRRHKILANVFGIGINALLLLVVILIIRHWMNKKPTVVTEEMHVTVPVKQESNAIVDPTNAPPPPRVADQGEPKTEEGTPARAIEDALRATNALRCGIQALKFNAEDGKLEIVLHRDVLWSVAELKEAIDHDALLVLRTVFLADNVKTVALVIEAPPAQKSGVEKALVLEVNRPMFEASGLADSRDTTIPPSLNPRYHPKLPKN